MELRYSRYIPESSGAPFLPIDVWLLTRDACHPTTPASNHTKNTLLSTALHTTDLLTKRTSSSFLVRRYNVNGCFSSATPDEQRQIAVSHSQRGHQHHATLGLLTTTDREDSKHFCAKFLTQFRRT